MAYADIGTYDMSDPINILIYINDQLYGFPTMVFLFMTWMIFAVGTYFINRRLTGDGDIAVAMTIGSFVTCVLAILLRTASEGVVSGTTVTIVFAVTIASFIFLLFTRRE